MANRPNITTVAAGSNYSATVFNDNMDAVADAIESCLGTSGTSGDGNTMSGTLDMNLNKIVNVPDPSTARDAANKQYVEAAIQAATLNTTQQKPSIYTMSDFDTLSDALLASSGSKLIINEVVSITDDTTIDSGVQIEVVLGGEFSVASGKTLTINGPFTAGLYQTFSGSGTVKFGLTSGNTPQVEWWGLDATALQSAIDSYNHATDGGEVRVGLSTIDIAGSTVRLRHKTHLIGVSRAHSKIVMANGSLSFGTYTSGKLSILENLFIYNSGIVSATVDASEQSTDGPYDLQIDNCRIQGGQFAIKMAKNGAVRINRTWIYNDQTTDSVVFAIYSNSGYVTNLSLTDNRILGRVYIHGNSSSAQIAGLNITGNAFEGYVRNLSNVGGNLLDISYVTGGNISGNYIEGWNSDGDGNLCLKIVASNGVNIAGNYFNTGDNRDVSLRRTNVDIQDSKGVTVGANTYYRISTVVAALTLDQYTSDCVVSPQWGYKTADNVIITDSGTNNTILSNSAMINNGFPAATKGDREDSRLVNVAAGGTNTLWTIVSTSTYSTFVIEFTFAGHPNAGNHSYAIYRQVISNNNGTMAVLLDHVSDAANCTVTIDVATANTVSIKLGHSVQLNGYATIRVVGGGDYSSSNQDKGFTLSRG